MYMKSLDSYYIIESRATRHSAVSAFTETVEFLERSYEVLLQHDWLLIFSRHNRFAAGNKSRRRGGGGYQMSCPQAHVYGMSSCQILVSDSGKLSLLHVQEILNNWLSNMLTLNATYGSS